METLTSTQTALFIGVAVIVLAVTQHYVIFACVYFFGFTTAYTCSNALLGRSHYLQSEWTVIVLKQIGLTFSSLQYKYIAFRKMLLQEKSTVQDNKMSHLQNSEKNILNKSSEIERPLHLLNRMDAILDANKDVPISKLFASSSSHSNQCRNQKTVESVLEHCVSYIIRDFICSWFQDISDNVEVVQECSDMLQGLFEDISNHSRKLDPFELFHRHIALFLSHLRDFQLSVARFKSQPSYRKKRDKERKEFKKLKLIEDCFDVLGKFHDVVSNDNSEKELNYWQCLLEVILVKSANKSLTSCSEVKHLLVDILATQVFLPLVDVMSDPHWLHKAIILITSEEEIEVIDGVSGNQQFPNPVQPNSDENMLNHSGDESVSVINESCRQSENIDEMNIEQFTTAALGELFPLTMSPQHLSVQNQDPEQSATNAEAQEETQPMFFASDDFQDCYDDSEDDLNLTAFISDELLTRDQYIPEGSLFSKEKMTEYPCDLWKNTSNDTVDDHDYIEQDAGNRDTQQVNVSDTDDTRSILTLHVDSVGPSHLFEEVQIVQTKAMKEAGGNGTFTMYCIQSAAWARNEPAGQGWHLREISVWRRYREFLTLHDRLQEHALYKPMIKAIKGPTRWRMIGKMDKDTVDKRQKFLQQYLQRLARDEMIGNSMALQEFLAYNGDANIAFVKKASDIPRIDKLLVKTFSGVFDKLTSVFDVADVPSRSRSQRALGGGDNLETDLNMGIVEVDCDFEREESQLFTNMLAEFISETNLFMEPPALTANATGLVGVPRSAGDGCENNTEPGSTECLPLMESVINLALCSVGSSETWTRKHRAVHMFKVAFGKAFDYWLRCEIEEITTKERFAHYLQKLSDTLWPDGELDHQPTTTPSEEQKIHTEEQARQCLHRFFPRFLPFVVGRENFKAGIDEILSCLSHSRLNRSFVYTSLDLALQTLYPDVGLPELQMSLLSMDSIHSNPENLQS